MGISKHPPRAESSPRGDQFLPPARREPRILSLPKLRQHYPAPPRDVSRGWPGPASGPGEPSRPGRWAAPGGRRAEPAFLLSDASEPTQVAHVA